MFMKRFVVVIGAVWLLVGCTAAELEAFNDSMNCVNAYPNNTAAQNQCMRQVQSYRDQQRTNQLVVWCNNELVRPMAKSENWLSANLSSFETDYGYTVKWLNRVGSQYNYYCASAEQRRADSANCERRMLEDPLNEVNSLLVRVEPIITEENRFQGLADAYNNHCMSLNGATWQDVGSNTEFLMRIRADLIGWRDGLVQALATW
ncbi:hypothetical protein [Pseudidiomarina woesei]|uniref:Lysozyme inhibitor LprI N-terminal domain-containing protein n=1 Tax=Pseudidiomarina woesei TaxID=1381080 RepID=A0A0K6GZD8_9GAMM|nr:hypothetical protein [Pseudidiomarina woesei]CUA83950.1 hypothetical protein Ga0061064_0820 [Pseudidiomarina woesei]